MTVLPKKKQLGKSTNLLHSKFVVSIEYLLSSKNNWTVCTKQCEQLDVTRACVKPRLQQNGYRFVCSSSSGCIWSADPDTYAVRILLLVFLQHSCYNWKWEIIVGTQMLQEKKIPIKIDRSIQMANLLSNLEAIYSLALKNQLLLGMDYVGVSLLIWLNLMKVIFCTPT